MSSLALYYYIEYSTTISMRRGFGLALYKKSGVIAKILKRTVGRGKKVLKDSFKKVSDKHK